MNETNRNGEIKNEPEKYSVLMSVYYKETADHLQSAMDSIWHQSLQPDDFVLVCDGPLGEALDSVIEENQENHPNLCVIRLKENAGLGNALNVGIKHCKNDLVARMDSDDISRPDRCEKQLNVFDSHPDISIVSGTIEEFSVQKELVESRRVLPEKSEEILKFSKSRCPFNHPCVMFRKKAVEEAGGYQSLYLLEDYYLWVRMLQKGFVGYNIQEPLLWMRVSPEMYKRRAGLKYLKSLKTLLKYMRDTSFITRGQYAQLVVVRTVSSLMPNGIRQRMYKRFVRNR